MKAIVLAAGFGTRLKPFTATVPKPLMTVWGEPMLARIVDMLRGWGVDDLVVNCHHLHGRIEAWVAEYAKANPGVKIRAAYEPEILGTGGVVNPLRDWIGGEEFYLVNGDVVVEFEEGDLEDFAEAKLGGEVIAAALVTEQGPRTIEVEPESGFVTNWKSDDAGYPGTFTYAGIARLSADVLAYVEPTGFSSVVAAYEKAMADGRFVKAVAPSGMMWTDAGTVESYVELNRTDGANGFASIPHLRGAFPSEEVAAANAVEFLGARGSDRAFFRAGDRIAIVYDDANRGENAKYSVAAKWLKEEGVAVPEIYSDDPATKTLVMEWGGIDRRMTLEEYVHVVEALAKFNAIDPKRAPFELEPRFDADLYRWERELFAEHCLGTRFRRELPAAAKEELENVAAILMKEPVALVHRDFQSTNVVWKNGKFEFIDFQGMREGAAVYDLASLVYDPYVTLSVGERRALIALYAKKAGRPEIEKTAHFAAVQRLTQCLGAYGRLASVGQEGFNRHVLPALQNLLEAADKCDLDAIAALAEELIGVETERRERAQGHAHDCACTGHGHGDGHECHCGHDHGDGHHCSCGGEHDGDGHHCHCGHHHHH